VDREDLPRTGRVVSDVEALDVALALQDLREDSLSFELGMRTASW